MKPMTGNKMQHVKVLAEVEPDAKDGADKPTHDEWELEDAARTLAKAEEIKADEKLMKALQPHLDKKMKAYKSLADLRQMGAAVKATGN